MKALEIKIKKEVKSEVKEVDEIIKDEVDRYYEHMCFKTWHVRNKFIYRNVFLHLCDTPSGCGPIQMFQYSDFHILENRSYEFNNFKYLLSEIIKDALTGHGSCSTNKDYFERKPVAITFIQGNTYRYPKVLKMLEELGFETRTYQNIAHGNNTSDKQTYFYLDLVKLNNN